MSWIFASVVLIIVVTLAIKFPVVWKGIGVLLAIAVISGLYFWQKEEARKERLEYAKTLIEPSDVVISDALLRGAGSYRTILGKIKNRSQYEIDFLSLSVVVKDCPTEGAPCDIIGQDDDVSAYVTVPPGQVRKFSMSATFRNMPKPSKLQWNYTFNYARAKLE